MTIKVIEYIKNGFSIEDADVLEPILKESIKNSDVVELDFKDVRFFTTLFFNSAITKFVKELTPEGYNKKIKLKNLSEVGESTYKHSYENAIEYYNIPEKDRSKIDKIFQDIDDYF